MSGCWSRAKVSPHRGGEVGVKSVDGEVHLGHPPGAFVEFLTVDGDGGAVFVVGVEKLLGLDEHATGSTAGIIDPSTGRLEDFDKHADDAGRGVELATAFSFRTGEFFQEVLVNLAEKIAGSTRSLSGELGGVEQVNQLTKAALIDVVAVEDTRQRACQGGVRSHDLVHGCVDELTDALRCLAVHGMQALGVIRQVLPAGMFRHPEHPVACVFVDVIDEHADLLFSHAVRSKFLVDLGATLGESVGDVLEEHQSKDDVLVLGGVHGTTEFIGGLPERVLQFFHGRGRSLVLLLRRQIVFLA